MKVNYNVAKNIKEKTKKTESVFFEIDGTRYTVQVATFFSIEVKEKMIAGIELLTEDFVQLYSEETMSILLLLKAVTDIEWEEDMAKNIDLLISLIEIGIVNNILDVVPENMLEEMSKFLIELASAQSSLAEEVAQLE